jgi:hypothetical protein
VKATGKSVDDPALEVDRALLAAVAAEETVREELRKAEEVAAAAHEAFLRDAKGIDAHLRAKAFAERAKLLHDEASAALATARARKAEADRARLLAEHEKAKAELPAAWEKAREPLIDRLIALDAALDALVLDFATATLAHQEQHDVATGRAQALGLPFGAKRLELADVQILACRAARLVREKEQRTPLGDWLENELGFHAGWKLNGAADAAEIRKRIELEDRNRQQDRDVRLIAAHMPPPPPNEGE